MRYLHNKPNKLHLLSSKFWELVCIPTAAIPTIPYSELVGLDIGPPVQRAAIPKVSSFASPPFPSRTSFPFPYSLLSPLMLLITLLPPLSCSSTLLSRLSLSSCLPSLPFCAFPFPSLFSLSPHFSHPHPSLHLHSQQFSSSTFAYASHYLTPPPLLTLFFSSPSSYIPFSALPHLPTFVSLLSLCLLFLLFLFMYICIHYSPLPILLDHCLAASPLVAFRFPFLSLSTRLLFYVAKFCELADACIRFHRLFDSKLHI